MTLKTTCMHDNCQGWTYTDRDWAACDTCGVYSAYREVSDADEAALVDAMVYIDRAIKTDSAVAALARVVRNGGGSALGLDNPNDCDALLALFAMELGKGI